MTINETKGEGPTRRSLLRVCALFPGWLFSNKRSVAATSIATSMEQDGNSVPFDYVLVDGSEVAERLEFYRSRHKGTPVVLGDLDNFRDLLELMKSSGTFESVVQQGLRVNVDQWIRERKTEDPEYYQAEGPDSPVSPVEPLTVVRDGLTGKFKPKIVIGLIPVAQPWQVAAYIRPRGWNECPSPEVQLAFFKRWNERYGAVVTSIAADVIEFTVDNPPMSVADAKTLAEEQFVYCPDIVHQGMGTLNNLAATLKGSPSWFFWWD